MASRQLVGFARGFAAPFGAARGLLAAPRAWPFALLPAALFVLIEGGVLVVSWMYLLPWVHEKLAGEGFWRNVGAWTGSVLSSIIFSLVGWLLAILLAQALSAPALERIVGIVERELGAPARAPLGFFAEFWCGIEAMLLSLAVSLPLVVGLTVVELVAPPLVVVVTPVKMLLAALGVAWGLFDYPLTLRGVGVRDRLKFVRRHLSAVLGFGVAFSLVFWLPCFGVLMLPVGVAAATRLYWEIERSAMPESAAISG